MEGILDDILNGDTNGSICTFCGKYVESDDEVLTEDAEISHKKCLELFYKHWEDRDENMDLLGY